MEKFESKSQMSFGVGAYLHRIVVSDKKLEITTGTPMNPITKILRFKNKIKIDNYAINTFLDCGDTSELPKMYFIKEYYKDKSINEWVQFDEYESNSIPKKIKGVKINVTKN